jgi:hypothetical protein
MDQITVQNNILEAAGVQAHYFTGYFAREVAKSGCEIYVSCANEQNIDYVKAKLRHFLDNQPNLH